MTSKGLSKEQVERFQFICICGKKGKIWNSIKRAETDGLTHCRKSPYRGHAFQVKKLAEMESAPFEAAPEKRQEKEESKE